MIRTLNIVGTDEKISYLGRIFKKFTAIRSLLIDQLCLCYDIALSIIHLKYFDEHNIKTMIQQYVLLQLWYDNSIKTQIVSQE